jgi:hypothetical protein
MKIYPGLAIGFRAWRIYSQKEIDHLRLPILRTNNLSGLIFDDFLPESPTYLYSLIHDEKWRSGINYALCNNKTTNHDAPGGDCKCGLNAFNNLSDADEYESFDDARSILGAVAGWGNLEIHVNGWRSEFATPLALLGEEDEHLKEIASFYKIPIFNNGQALITYTEQFGQVPEF